jgi:hypothetical protein
MVQMATLRRRSWAGMVWLLIGSAALVVALELGNTLLLVAALVAASVCGWLLLGQALWSASSQPAAAHGEVEPRVQRSILMADGTPRQALVVPAESANGYQTVLTIDGYALANTEGRVVYALSREAPAKMDEPVVVTIFDSAEATFEEELVAA